jgi:hypothetical protein
MDLAIDAALAHTSRNELRVLRTEVENQDAMRMDVYGMQSRRISRRLGVHGGSLFYNGSEPGDSHRQAQVFAS